MEALDQLAETMKTEGLLVEIQGFTPDTAQPPSSSRSTSRILCALPGNQSPDSGLPNLRTRPGQCQGQTASDDTTNKPRTAAVEVTLLKNGVGDLQAASRPAMSQQQ